MSATESKHGRSGPGDEPENPGYSHNGHSGHNGHKQLTDPAALRDEIARTRADLGQTVEALAAKADVKARAQEAMHSSVTAAKLRMREGVDQVAANAAYAGRELRTHPRQSMQTGLQRMVRSARERPAPWYVASALLILAGFVRYRSTRRLRDC